MDDADFLAVEPVFSNQLDTNTTMESMNNNTWHRYEDGEEIPETWNPVFVVFAYMIACVSAYSAVHLLDHGLWRSDEVKKAAIIKHPDIWAASMLGFGSVWCMHFVGMAAVTLDGTPICFDWLITIGSLGVVVALMIAGIKVAGNDVFASPDRAQILEEILGRTKYASDEDAAWAVTRITAFYKLQYLALGSFLAASGAVVMHYTGMLAKKGPFVQEWDVAYIAASVASAIVICFVGFWIIFRLRWQIKQLWLRLASAAIISLAVCFLHFFGMLSVTYYADNDSPYDCQSTSDKHNESPNAWNVHQVVVVAVCILVPTLSLAITNIINQELILAYEDAAQSSAIVSSLFPAQIRDRMLAEGQSKIRKSLDHDSETDDVPSDVNGDLVHQSKPIADLFPETTVMFADIAGFTAWSSQREPSQVFTLLETVYHAFDKISAKHCVFKVETIGDCYVAVSGCPDPRKDHAVVMGRVASDCVYKMGILTKRLERALGPDTGDLNIRIGLHSGPVTGGVLRGERARFQLFGDTMNHASRMESTGLPGRVQVSSETAELLKNEGKGEWVIQRESEVFVKGKGNLSTYWLCAKGSVHSASQASSDDTSRFVSLLSDADKMVASTSSPSTPSTSNLSAVEKESSSVDDSAATKRESRLVAWNVDILVRLLQQILASRGTVAAAAAATTKKAPQWISAGTTPMDEVVEVIQLPEKKSAGNNGVDPNSIEIDPKMVQLIHDYVSSLAKMYPANPFHCFEHACHVTMSVAKLLSRIVTPDDGQAVASLHDHSYGITSDPLTQLACVLSALIHDVDHQGVPNATLVAEESPLAERYGGKSLAEQNSVDIAWNLLMTEKFQPLVSLICQDDVELARFRQLIVNTVMATDIMDKDLKTLRNARWDKAFSQTSAENNDTSTREVVNRKATIVIEHLIQASDVSHTMQHWNVYQKWNERLFKEMYKAFKEGRSNTDPSEFWYQGEIGFFDFYIIPLAKKLKECGVFGVCSDEYLQYAVNNRNEWERKGKTVVENLIASVN